MYQEYGSDLALAQVVAFPWRDEEIVQLPEPKAQRTLGRTGLLLMAAALQSRAPLEPFLKDDPFSIGIYCALENGPQDYQCCKRMAYTPPEEFARLYKSLRSPTQFLRQIPNIPPAQLCIFLGIMGPQNVFTHSRWGCIHALEQAEFDLRSRIVRVALICSAFSLEDPLLAMRIRRSLPGGCTISEGAAAMALVDDDTYTDWRSKLQSHSPHFYGTAHDLVQLTATRRERA